jgi:undecaprenol kinase/diacylglycerol kinase (ATP)
VFAFKDYNMRNKIKSQKFSIKKRLKSFSYAFSGLKTAVKEEHNARIHLVAAVAVVAFAFFFELNSYEWIAIIFAIGFVFAMELINSAIENTADFISLKKHDTIRKIKDLSAAAVLISALTALAVGLIIFLPKIWKLVC